MIRIIVFWGLCWVPLFWGTTFSVPIAPQILVQVLFFCGSAMQELTSSKQRMKEGILAVWLRVQDLGLKVGGLELGFGVEVF